MTVKRRDHILVKHRADVIRDSVSVSAVQYFFRLDGYTLLVQPIDSIIYSRHNQRKVTSHSFYLNKCPHLQYLSSV